MKKCGHLANPLKPRELSIPLPIHKLDSAHLRFFFSDMCTLFKVGTRYVSTYIWFTKIRYITEFLKNHSRKILSTLKSQSIPDQAITPLVDTGQSWTIWESLLSFQGGSGFMHNPKQWIHSASWVDRVDWRKFAWDFPESTYFIWNEGLNKIPCC